MNILIICDQLTQGGAARVAVMLANGLEKRNYKICFATNLNKDIAYDLNKNVDLCGFIPKGANTPIKLLKAIYNVRKLIKKSNPDVIIGFMGLCSIIAWIASIGRNIPIVATEHNSFEFPKETPMPFSLKISKFYLNKLYDCVTVLTKTDLEIIGDRLTNVVVMPNPLFLTPNEGPMHKDKIILACGRISAWKVKGFDILIKAWGKIHMKYPEWRVQIVGGSDKNSIIYLQQLCKECSVSDSVVINGIHSDVLPYYQRADVFVLSSRHEGFGLVLIEAMSQQCACVACSYKKRLYDIIDDGIDGLLCESGNVDSLVNSLTKILDDAVLRNNLRTHAVVKSKQYSEEEYVNKWEDLLSRVFVR